MNIVVNPTSGDYRVGLEVFHGPLDLLLYLINKDELDVYDIPIARITREYLQYVDLMTTLNLEVAGEFILMAATLIRIKTRMLLPQADGDDNEHDPREELILALIEYRKFREAGEILRERAIIEERNFTPPSPLGDMKTRVDLSPGTSLFDLLTAFRDLLEARRDEVFHNVDSENLSVEDRVRAILAYMAIKDGATFVELFADVGTRIAAVVTFIALLELCRTRRISLAQSRPFAEMRVYRGNRF
ncbi:MAG: segregation and condensation protein A, partial [Candidatus Zixiibacteriota bacterium]